MTIVSNNCTITNTNIIANDNISFCCRMTDAITYMLDPNLFYDFHPRIYLHLLQLNRNYLLGVLRHPPPLHSILGFPYDIIVHVW